MMIFKETILLGSAAALLGVLRPVDEGSGAAEAAVQEDNDADVDEAMGAGGVAGAMEADGGNLAVDVNGTTVGAAGEADVEEADSGVSE